MDQAKVSTIPANVTKVSRKLRDGAFCMIHFEKSLTTGCEACKSASLRLALVYHKIILVDNEMKLRFSK